MQVSIPTILSLTLSLILTLALPTFLAIYFHKKEKISLKPFFIGILIWCITKYLLETGINILFSSQLFGLLPNTIITNIFQTTLTAICEVGIIYILFKKLLTTYHQQKHAISFALGNGVIQTLLISSFNILTLLLFAITINLGKIEQIKTILPKQIFIHFINTTYYMQPDLFLVISLEQLSNAIFQIALTILILLSIRKQKLSYLFLATALHALFALIPTLYLWVNLNIWIADTLIMLCGIGSGVFIWKSKKAEPSLG